MEAQFEKIWKNQGQKILPFPQQNIHRKVAVPALSVLPCWIQPQEGLKCAGFKPRKNSALKSRPKILHTHTLRLWAKPP